ncbi:MAG: polysaccharide deacetylase family protein, partial [Candidatus Thermoplasmatota archaeon]
MSRTWLTVDTDDAHHRPWRQGHPTRSKDPDGGWTPRQPSEGWLRSIERFGDWMEHSGHAVTVFVIQDQLEQPDARKALLDLAARGGPQLTFASHGTSHRAWGAWPEDAARLTAAVKLSFAANAEAFGEQARPWFRAPSGYVAPWMADALADAGVTVDSSVNPSRLVRKKAGPTRRWSDVVDAMS